MTDPQAEPALAVTPGAPNGAPPGMPEFERDERLTQLREQLQRWLRGYRSAKTRTSHAERLGLPRHLIPRLNGDPAPQEGSSRGRGSTGTTEAAWLTWCWRHQVPYLQPSRDDLNRWLDELSKRGFAQRSQAAMLSSVSSFYRHLIREGVLEVNPVDRVDRAARNLRTSGQPKATRPFTFSQVRALLEAAWLLAEQSRNGLRDRAMLEVLAGTGLRADELVQLDRAHYHRPSPGAPGVLTVHGKGGSVRTIGTPVEVADAVDDYLADQPAAATVVPNGQAGGRLRQPLFATTAGARLHTSHIGGMLRRLVDTFVPNSAPRERWKQDLLRSAVGTRVAAELAPLKGAAHPHRLRHAYGTNAINAGVPIRQVQKDLGHKDVSTTETYVHDEHQAAHSASHQLAPGLHRGWLTPRTVAQRERTSQRGEFPGQTGMPLHDDTEHGDMP